MTRSTQIYTCTCDGCDRVAAVSLYSKEEAEKGAECVQGHSGDDEPWLYNFDKDRDCSLVLVCDRCQLKPWMMEVIRKSTGVNL